MPGRAKRSEAPVGKLNDRAPNVSAVKNTNFPLKTPQLPQKSGENPKTIISYNLRMFTTFFGTWMSKTQVLMVTLRAWVVGESLLEDTGRARWIRWIMWAMYHVYMYACYDVNIVCKHEHRSTFLHYIYICDILWYSMCLLWNMLNVLPFPSLRIDCPRWSLSLCISWCSFGNVMWVVPGEISYSYSHTKLQSMMHPWFSVRLCSHWFPLRLYLQIGNLVCITIEHDPFLNDLHIFKHVDYP